MSYLHVMHPDRAALLLFVTLLVLELAACSARVGPKNIPTDRFDYSSAITRSWKEQMLLNMIKLRYLDPPVFLDIQQVVQQYTREGTGAIVAPGWTGDSTIAPAASVAGRWAESPTITYAPLSGDKFTKSLLRPVSPVDIFSLVQSGWPIDAIFEIAVRSINGLHAGSRTEMLRRSGDPDFYRVIALLRELQATDSFGIRVVETNEVAAVMVFRAHIVNEATAATSRKVRELLHLNLDAQEFRLATGAVQQDDKEIAMLTRSMLEILAEASAGVEIPASDVDQGRVVRMGSAAENSEAQPKFLIHVHSSTAKPNATDAFTTVQYRNLWFWVDDRDVPSKRGLSFLMILFTLVGSETAPAPPALTISKP